MNSKRLWLDLETTGLSHTTHSIIQLAALFEIDGKVEVELNLKMRPMLDRQISPDALEKTGKTVDELDTYPHPSIQFEKFEKKLAYYVNKFDKFDKFVLSGYNISAFDDLFLRQFFIDNAKTKKDRRYGGYYGSWIYWPKCDVQTFVAEHIITYNLNLPNFQLETVCKHFNIAIDAHDALSDIRATRQLYQILRYSLPMQP